jgi:diguanylate cyclase (GGDEF)-like protein
MYYSVIGLIALVVLIIENQDILAKLDSGFDKPAWKVYRMFLFSVIVYYVTDILWGVLEYFKLAAALFVDTSVYFIAMALGIPLWTQYVVTYLDEKKTFSRFLLYAGRILAVAVTLLSVLNIFIPIMFAVDDKCVYTPLPFRYAVLISQIVLLLLISLHALLYIMSTDRSGEKSRRYITMAHFGLIMALLLILQIWFPYLPLYAMAYMLGTCLLRAFVVRIEKEEYRLENEEMKRHRLEEQVHEEQVAYRRINALAGDFLSVYVVDPVTERYREFSSKEEFKGLNLAEEGTDFFETTIRLGRNVVCPEDMDRFLSGFSRDIVMAETANGGVYSLNYRIMLGGRENYIQLKAAMVDEEDGSNLIVGINDVDAQMRKEEEYASRLANAQTRANVDALTGVRNRYAYLDAVEKLDKAISEGEDAEFAMVILDVNDLKKVNDTQGHQAGDQYLRDACKIICDTFKRSPVFRIGGDEFAVIAQGEDYKSIDELTGMIAEHNMEAIADKGIIVACGMSRFEKDDSAHTVVARADQLMYENKSSLKAAQ